MIIYLGEKKLEFEDIVHATHELPVEVLKNIGARIWEIKEDVYTLLY